MPNTLASVTVPTAKRFPDQPTHRCACPEGSFSTPYRRTENRREGCAKRSGSSPGVLSRVRDAYPSCYPGRSAGFLHSHRKDTPKRPTHSQRADLVPFSPGLGDESAADETVSRAAIRAAVCLLQIGRTIVSRYLTRKEITWPPGHNSGGRAGSASTTRTRFTWPIRSQTMFRIRVGKRESGSATRKPVG
jgi:hypothetical protein